MTMTLIQSITVDSSGPLIVEFTAVPQSFTDLVVVGSVRANRATPMDEMRIRLNNSTATSGPRLRGNGVSASSVTDNIPELANGTTSTANTFSNFQIYVPNYTSAAEKTFSVDGVTENNATEAYQSIMAGNTEITATVTSVRLDTRSAVAILENSYFALYGITKGFDGITTAS